MYPLMRRFLNEHHFHQWLGEGTEIYSSQVRYNEEVIDGETYADNDIVRITKTKCISTDDSICSVDIIRSTVGGKRGSINFHQTLPINYEPSVVVLNDLIKMLDIKIN